MSTTYVTHDDLITFGRKLVQHYLTQDDLKRFEQKLLEQLVTSVQLEEFRKYLMADIKKLIAKQEDNPNQDILKSDEVMRKLKVCPNTMLNYRRDKILPFNKIGNTIYYKREDVLKLAESLEAQRASVVDRKFNEFMRKIKKDSNKK